MPFHPKRLLTNHKQFHLEALLESKGKKTLHPFCFMDKLPHYGLIEEMFKAKLYRLKDSYQDMGQRTSSLRREGELLRS